MLLDLRVSASACRDLVDVMSLSTPLSYHPDLKKKAGGVLPYFHTRATSVTNKEHTPKMFTSSLTAAAPTSPPIYVLMSVERA